MSTYPKPDRYIRLRAGHSKKNPDKSVPVTLHWNHKGKWSNEDIIAFSDEKESSRQNLWPW